MFSTTNPNSDLIAKLSVLSEKDYLRNALQVGMGTVIRVHSFNIPEPLESRIDNFLIWFFTKVRKTFTDEVILVWKFANEHRSLSNYFQAARVTVITTLAWLAG